MASAPSTARVGLGVGEYAVESEIAGLPRVKGRLTRVQNRRAVGALELC